MASTRAWRETRQWQAASSAFVLMGGYICLASLATTSEVTRETQLTVHTMCHVWIANPPVSGKYAAAAGSGWDAEAALGVRAADAAWLS